MKCLILCSLMNNDLDAPSWHFPSYLDNCLASKRINVELYGKREWSLTSKINRALSVYGCDVEIDVSGAWDRWTIGRSRNSLLSDYPSLISLYTVCSWKNARESRWRKGIARGTRYSSNWCSCNSQAWGYVLTLNEPAHKDRESRMPGKFDRAKLFGAFIGTFIVRYSPVCKLHWIGHGSFAFQSFHSFHSRISLFQWIIHLFVIINWNNRWISEI